MNVVSYACGSVSGIKSYNLQGKKAKDLQRRQLNGSTEYFALSRNGKTCIVFCIYFLSF